MIGYNNTVVRYAQSFNDWSIVGVVTYLSLVWLWCIKNNVETESCCSQKLNSNCLQAVEVENFVSKKITIVIYAVHNDDIYL